MAPPGAGVHPEETQRTGRDLNACPATTFFTIVLLRTPSRLRFCVPLNTEAAHDFQQACVVRQSELLGRLGDVPVVSLESLNDDLALGFLFLFFEGARVSARASYVVRRA